MDLAGPNHGFDIFQVYQRYCEIVSRNAYACVNEGFREEDGSQKANSTREELAELMKAVDSCVYARTYIYDQLQNLMSLLGLMADFSEFSRFYDFVFFMCRENGQKNIAVNRAICAWKLVLAGRFRLLSSWCEFVQKNQRHNISEDTWRQVLAFSRCVHENLEGYDPEGAWPVLIDDFVEYMYRVNGTNDNFSFSCNCGGFEAQTRISEDPLSGLKLIPGLKRKIIAGQESKSTELIPRFKRQKQITAIENRRTLEGKSPGLAFTDALDITKHTNSPCAVEGCLSKGFAGLFSTASRLQVDRKSYI